MITTYSYKNIWKVSFPIMLGLLAQNVMSITDTIFLGRVGEVELGASGLAGIFYIAFFMLGFGFSVGAQIMISRRNGEGNYSQIGSIVIQGILFLQLFALILFFSSSYFAKMFLPQMIHSKEVYSAAEDYLSWRTYGFFFAFINIMFRAYYVGVARTSVLTLNAVVMAIANIILDYAFIFGNWGFPQLGVAGAGLASVLSEAISVVFFTIYTYQTVDLDKFGFKKMRFKFSIVKRILSISIFTMLQYSISLSTWFIFFLAISNNETHGERNLAITNIIRTFYMIFFIPMNALSTTANTLVGNTIGAGRYKDVLPLIKRIALLNLAVIVVLVIITAVSPIFWISMIASNKDMSLVLESVNALLILLSVLPIASVSTVLFNSISGTGNTKTALSFEVITMFLYILGLWIIVVHNQSSVALCWTIEHIYWGTLLVLSFLYLRFGKWQNKKL